MLNQHDKLSTSLSCMQEKAWTRYNWCPFLCKPQTYLHSTKPKSVFSYPKPVSHFRAVRKVSREASGGVRDGLWALVTLAPCKRDSRAHHLPLSGKHQNSEPGEGAYETQKQLQNGRTMFLCHPSNPPWAGAAQLCPAHLLSVPPISGI